MCWNVPEREGKQGNMKAGSIADFKHLSQFGDIKDFNNNIEQWLVDIKKEFTKGELVALKRLIRYACKFAGVSNAKIQTIISATHEGSIGISRSTFERMLRKAKKLGLIVVHNTKRGNFQGHNVYVFQCYQSKIDIKEQNDVVKKVKIDVPNKTNNPSETNNQNINKRNKAVFINNRKENVKHTELNAEFVSERVPSAFTNLVKCFFDNAGIIEELYKMYAISVNKLKPVYEDSELLHEGLEAFKQTIRSMKLGKVRNMYAYYYGTLQKKLDSLYYCLIEEIQEGIHIKPKLQNATKGIFYEFI
ncbi:hypothetical protein [Bacillus pseudomycoides]|uniref:hypothetical protein n=2 Tax=Bacillus pseudomycoides TaxID=64104 RepID=UPI00211D9870|nr:hypothetical protein [Bacillus pseudomycoides]